MRRVALAVAAGCLALFVGVVALTWLRDLGDTTRITRRQAQLRYQQCQPRHWRSLFLQP